MIHIFSAFLQVKESLCDPPGVRRHARALGHDQNDQFMRIGQFLSNYKG